MRLYRDPLYFMIYEKVGDQDLAKDLTIESIGKAFKKLHLYVPDHTFSTWLFTVAKNHCIDYLRKKKLPTSSIDKIFGFFFGFIRGYIICVCLFTCINYVYNHKNWELNINNSKTFS